MKTITISFLQEGTQIGRVSGKFATLPGPGTLQWTNKFAIEARTKAPYRTPLPDEHFAELFQRALEAFALHHGWQADVVEEGDWQVFTE